MNGPIQRSGQLTFHQPGIEATAFHFRDAVLLFAEMALADTRQPLSLLAGQAGGQPLLVKQVQLMVEMVHQSQQRISLLDLLLAELTDEPTHRILLRIF